MKQPGMVLKPGPGMSKLSPNISTNNTQGSVQAPSATFAGAELTTETYTYFARPALDGQPPVLYNGDRQFARVTLELQTAGPVIVSTKQQVYPVTSGFGVSLTTGEPREFIIAKGTRLWVGATSLNVIAVTIEPLPWLEQITGTLVAAVSGGRR